ncbi:MAG: zinc-ribbon domain-containing protein [Terriglobales bacterium]
MKRVPYACHKCGTMIEEGTPFCPHCGAPQIRVSIPESDSPAFTPGTPAEMQPPAEPVPLAPIPRSSPAIPWRKAMRAVLLGAAVILIGSMLPLGVLWNVLVIAIGGAIAVAFVRRQDWAIHDLGASGGAKIGAAAAFCSYVISAILLVLSCVLDGPGVRQQFINRLQATQSQLGDPNSREIFQTLIDKVKTPEGFATLVTIGLAMSFVIFVVIGAAGGAIGATLMQRDRHL